MAVSRRQLLVFALAGAAFPCAGPARSQVRPRRIGVLQFAGGMMNRDKPGGMAFIAAMKELGYVEGRDYLYDEHLWPSPELAVATARELVDAKPDVIIAAGPPSIVAARRDAAHSHRHDVFGRARGLGHR